MPISALNIILRIDQTINQKQFFFTSHLQNVIVDSKQVHYLILTVMKSQLQRILKSDLSQYKIAVSEHVSNLDHFEECLTERSNFMQNFNEMLKKQLSKIGNAPVEQCKQDQPQRQRKLQNISTPRQQLTDRYIEQVQENSRQDIESESIRNHAKHQIKLHYMIQKLQELKYKTLNLWYSQLQKIKSSIIDEIEKTKRKSINNCNQQFIILTEMTRKEYQTKIKQLQATIEKLKEQNFTFRQEQLKEDSHRTIEKQVFKSNNCNLERDPCASYSKKDNPQQPPQKMSFSNYTNKEMNGLPNQTQMLIKQITLKNNQPKWKHYICDLENTSIKEVKNTQKPNQNNQNLIISGGSKEFNFSILQNPKIITSKQPNLPAPLRKNSLEISYDIPAVKSLLVAYPPIEQGFSILKMGSKIVYKGMWKYKRFHGKGKLTLQEYSYEGDFQEGLFHGRGSLKIGLMEYIGEFCQNKANGHGTLKIRNQQIIGRWKNNIFVDKP